MVRLYTFIIVFFLMVLTRCGTPEFLSPAELNNFILEPKNGLVKTVEVNGYRIDVTFRPTDLWVHQELGENSMPFNEIEKLREKYDHYYYFILSLSRNNKEALHQVSEGMGKYSELVQVLSFRMPEYTTLTTAAYDTIPVADFMLNRTYGFNASTDLLFVFNREKAQGQSWVQFNLNEFGLGVGNHRFRFSNKDLDRAPGINFQEL